MKGTVKTHRNIMEIESRAMFTDGNIYSGSSSSSSSGDYKPGEDAGTVDHVDRINVDIATITANKSKVNHPLWSIAMKIANNNRAAALKMLEDPDEVEFMTENKSKVLDPLWNTAMKIANNNRAAALEMLEDPDAVQLMKSQGKSKTATKAPSAVPPLPSVVPGTNVANIGEKRPSEKVIDKRKQCHMCAKWYQRVNRHLEDVHKLRYNTLTDKWEKQLDDAPPADMDIAI